MVLLISCGLYGYRLLILSYNVCNSNKSAINQLLEFVNWTIVHVIGQISNQYSYLLPDQRTPHKKHRGEDM